MPLSQAQATVIGSGMGLIGNLFSGLGAKRKQKYAKEMMDYQNKLELERMEQQFGYQQKAAEQEQQYALDMYNHQFNTESAYNKEMLEDQRKYDSPVEEMARLKEAGVNPALYYSSGGGSGGSGIGAMGVSASGSSASVGAPTGIQPMAVQVGLQAQQQEASIELTRAQAAKDQLREAIRAVIRKELAEVQPAVAPTKPSPGPTIHPGKSENTHKFASIKLRKNL